MTYVNVWVKYLPVIKIMLKRASESDQTFELNRVDFERAGGGRKTGYKFNVEFSNGRVANVISGSPMASDLATVLMSDQSSREILERQNVTISLNTKYQLLFSTRGNTHKKRAETRAVDNGNEETAPGENLS